MRDNRIMHGIGLALLLGFGAGALWDGLYAPGQQLVGVGLVACLALVTHRPLQLAAVEGFAFCLFLVGMIGSLLSPAAAGVAAHGPVIGAGWLLAWASGRALFGMGSSLGTGMDVEGYLARFWAIMGTLIAFGGMGLFSLFPPHHSGRMASLLGYPIAVGMIGLLGLVGSLPDLVKGRRWSGLLLFGNSLGLLLSGSRGVWAVALLVAAYLGWARWSHLCMSFRQSHVREALLRGLVGGSMALATALWAAPAIQRGVSIELALLLLASVLTVWLLDRFHRYRSILLAGLLVAGFGLATAPGWSWLLGRATALPLTEGSSVERLTFLRDGWSLLVTHPWGAGYRGWAALHLQAASYGYYSAEVHSALLDFGIAFGWAGGLALLLLVGRLLYHLRHGRDWSAERLVLLSGLGALALHAMVDWELSYGLFAFLLWFGFGLLGSGNPPRDEERGEEQLPEQGVSLRPGGRAVRGRLYWPAGLTITLAGLALAGALLLGGGDIATEQAGRSLAQGQVAGGLRFAEVAISLGPWNDLAYGYKAQALAAQGQPGAALEALARARRLGPREPWYAQMEALQLTQLGRPQEAVRAWREAVALWPWQLSLYEQALTAHLGLIEQAERAGEQALAHELAESGAAILTALERQKAKEPVGAPRKGMEVTGATIQRARELIGQRLAP